VKLSRTARSSDEPKAGSDGVIRTDGSTILGADDK